MKSLLALILLAGSALPALAQSTTVSATVTDTDGFAWKAGTYRISFVPNPSIPNPQSYIWSGGNLQQNNLFQAALTSSGAFSVTIPDNSFIAPAGSMWQFTACPNATTGCVNIILSANGSTLNLTSQLSAAAIGPRFADPGNAYGYGTVEVSPLPKPGAVFFNTTDSTCHQWGTSGWQTCATGASSGITQLTGPVTAGPGSGSQVSMITPTGVTAGNYTYAAFTVNAAGQMTAASNGSVVQTINGTPGAFTFTGSGVSCTTTTCTFSTGSGITQLTGDATAGPGSGSQALTLATVNSNVGTYGDATHVSRVTVNGKGLVTAASQVAITGGSATEIQVNGVDTTAQTPANFQSGTNVTVSNPSAGNIRFDAAANFQPTLSPPIGGQYLTLYPNACTVTPVANGAASCFANGASASGSLFCNSGSLSPCSNTTTYTFTLPAGVTQGQVTAVYEQLTSSFTGYAGSYGIASCTDGPDMRVPFNTGLQTAQGGPFSPLPTISTMSCVFNLQSSGGNPLGATVQVSSLVLYVYYTGTPVSSPSGTTIYPPLLTYNGGLGISLPLASAVDLTNTNSYNVTVPAYAFPNQFSINDDIWLTVTNANTSTTPTIALNGSNAYTVVKSSGALAVGDIAASPIVNHLVFNGTNWQILNPATGLGGSASILCSGQITFNPGSITQGTVSSATTATCTGLTTSDNIILDFAADPTGTTGYAPTTNGTVTIVKYPTANTINVKAEYNGSLGTITPGSVTLNYRVPRP